MSEFRPKVYFLHGSWVEYHALSKPGKIWKTGYVRCSAYDLMRSRVNKAEDKIATYMKHIKHLLDHAEDGCYCRLGAESLCEYCLIRAEIDRYDKKPRRK
ncbi:MAG: hypothetical protein KAR42_16245 [candidate division Zixibacteria bacterium]|nr:hypothetical protein [candidate division Zixibacteria bacterium]